MKSTRFLSIFLSTFFLVFPGATAFSQGNSVLSSVPPSREEPRIYDDKSLINAYAEKFSHEPLEILLAMIKDDTLDPLKMTAAVKVFREKYSDEVFSHEKAVIEKILFRRLNRTDSALIQVEIMHTLCQMDRYKYFKSLAPILLLKLDHYNSSVYEMASESMNDIIAKGNDRAWEARIVFDTLRKMLFLSRGRLANMKEPSPRLQAKLNVLRWSIKILGSQELNRLPKEVIHLL